LERNTEKAARPQSSAEPAGAGAPAKGAAFDPRDLVPEPLFCLDGDGRLIWVNNAAEKLSGYEASQLIGQPFAMLITPSKRRRLTSYFMRHLHLREEPECGRDVPLLTRTGTTAWVGARVRRVRTLHGKVGYVACAHDLHDMVFEIERLRRDVRDLHAKTIEATAAAQLKGDFLATMTEEIRTPMDGLLAMTKLLLESNLDRDQRTFAEVIHGSSEALLTLVNDILDFNKIEAGELTMESLDFDVRVTVDGTAALLSPTANAKGIELLRQVHHDVPSQLVGDPGRLRQVLTNLVRRLLQFLDQGQVQVWVNLVEETPHDTVLRFSVSYVSPAPPEELGDLVQVFGQADVAKAKQLGGDALAFAISRRLIALMGGNAGGEAQDAGGTLWFQIPFKRAEERAPMAPLPDVELGGMRVLVADPSAAMRMAVTEMLSSWGCIADEAEDGAYAFTLLREAAKRGRPYRVAILESQLPVIDAEDLSKAIRKDPELAETRLMLLATVGRRGDAARAQELGFSAYLVKPFEPSYLFDALVEVVHRGPDGDKEGIVTRHSVAERRRQRMRILLVEDNSVNQLVAVAALRRAGFNPDTASSGSEAVQAHALHHFDIIFLDTDLPDVEPIEVARQIAQMEEGTGRKTSIIATVSDDAPETRVKLLEAGFKGCLGKPLDLDAMVQAVDRWVQPDGALESKAGESPKTAATEATPAPAATAAKEVPAPSAEPTKAAEAAEVAPSKVVPPPPAEAEAEDDDSEPVLDESRLKSSSMGNANLENILIGTFVHHIRPRLERLREVAASGDAAAVELEAHGIKGMCGTIGAMACADVFARIERLAREKRLEPVKPMLDYAEIEVSRVEVLIAPRAAKAA
jgi:PAS domain S-box-containing protein